MRLTMTESPCVRIHRATVADKGVIAEMMQAYQLAMSPFTGAEPDMDGRFTYRYFDMYWSPEGVAEGRIPYLIIADDEVAGFAFVNAYSRLGNTPTRNIAEFHVKDCWRRKRVGTKAVQQLFTMHPGRWEIAVLQSNTPALAFWISAANEIVSGQFTITATDPDIWNGSVITLEYA